jgi:hypothetical protein
MSAMDFYWILIPPSYLLRPMVLLEMASLLILVFAALVWDSEFSNNGFDRVSSAGAVGSVVSYTACGNPVGFSQPDIVDVDVPDIAQTVTCTTSIPISIGVNPVCQCRCLPVSAVAVSVERSKITATQNEGL